jgi:hypothetical protein
MAFMNRHGIQVGEPGRYLLTEKYDLQRRLLLLYAANLSVLSDLILREAPLNWDILRAKFLREAGIEVR